MGFDADLTAAVEALHECRRVADYAIVVQDVLPMNGWPWAAICKELVANPSVSPSTLCKSIVTLCQASYAKSKAGVAVSATDLRTLDRLSDQMTQLVNALTVAYPIDYPT